MVTIEVHFFSTFSPTMSTPNEKRNVISVSAGSSMALSAELELLKSKFNTERKAPGAKRGSASSDADIMSKVYKKGTGKSLKGHRNKLQKVSIDSCWYYYISFPFRCESSLRGHSCVRIIDLEL